MPLEGGPRGRAISAKVSSELQFGANFEVAGKVDIKYGNHLNNIENKFEPLRRPRNQETRPKGRGLKIAELIYRDDMEDGEESQRIKIGARGEYNKFHRKLDQEKAQRF
jgi:hypothetical protein